MYDLMVKSVDVLGDTIMAAKDTDGTIWVGVRWMCQGMGMSEGQYKRQITNIQKDLLLKSSGSNLNLNKGSGEREVFCLKLDYLPIWLAKISITPKIQKEHPELAQKLLVYQLKAKDILAAAFLPQHDTQPLSLQQQIQTIAKGTDELYHRVDEVKEEVSTMKAEVEEIKNDLPLLPIEADDIVKAVKKKGVEVLGTKQSPAYKDRGLRQKVYNDIYANLKHNFGGIKSYKAIRRRDAGKAVQVVNGYRPPLFLEEQIEQANAQITMDTVA